MATKTNTKPAERSGASTQPAPAAAESRASSSAEQKDAEQKNAEQADSRAEAAAKQEEATGKVFTSTSNSPQAIPVSQAVGAGADQAKTDRRPASGDHMTVPVEGGVVVPTVDAEGNAKGGEAKSKGGKRDLASYLEQAPIGTVIEKGAAGIRVTTSVGGGITRSFAGGSFEEVVAEQDEFLGGSPRLIQQDIGESAEQREEREEREKGGK